MPLADTVPSVQEVPDTACATDEACPSAFDISDLFATAAPRPQQADCVRSVCKALQADCTKETPSNYLIQHATGSGKSLTIAALAHSLTKLKDSHGNRFWLVIVVADRKALESQLHGTVQEFFAAHGSSALLDRAESSLHLRQLLSNDGGAEGCRVVVTTFQKALDRTGRGDGTGIGRSNEDADDHGDADDDALFEEESDVETAELQPAADAAVDGNATTSVAGSGGACMQPRVAILADEAHRSHGRGTTAALHALLCGQSGQPRHISYVSFTATPSEIALRLFGVTNHVTGVREPFHCFSMRQALAAGHCVDVLARYTTARPSVSIRDTHGRPKELEHVISASHRQGASARARQRAAAAEEALFTSKARGTLDFVCDALAEAKRSGMADPKAMMVVRSRQHCADYRRALLRLIDEQTPTSAEEEEDDDDDPEGGCTAEAVRGRLTILVAFSGTLSSDRGQVTERTLNGGEVLSLFGARGPALLIVCSKLETGFDEPRVCAMVIDRVLRGAHAVQVLGRANRAAPRKPPVRVLDFANGSGDIASAFRGFLGASNSPVSAGERRVHLGRELAHISATLLRMIADRSVRAVVSEAISSDRHESLAASVEEYVQGCEALGEELVNLPYGFATRLLVELKAAAADAPQPRAASRGSFLEVGAGPEGFDGGDGRGDNGPTIGGYDVRAGSLATTFSGRIRVDGMAEDTTGTRTRPLSQAVDLNLNGDSGARLPLSEAVATANSLAERAVQAMLATPFASTEAQHSVAAMKPWSVSELSQLEEKFRGLTSGRAVTIADGEALLLRAYHRIAPSVQALRATKAGASLKALSKSHSHATITSLAAALMNKWKAAAEAESKRIARAAALHLPPTVDPASEPDVGGGGGAGAAGGGGGHAAKGSSATAGDDSISQSIDPMRQTAACQLAEALRAGQSESGSAEGERGSADGVLAAAIERALFSASGGGTGKAYRSRARLLCSSLRSSRSGALRKRLRDGELSADVLCGMGEKELAEALLSEEQKEAREAKRQREARAIETLRIDNMGEASEEYTCRECKSRRCQLFHTNSMGAVHLTAVPDMIVQCLDCGHRFTL